MPTEKEAQEKAAFLKSDNENRRRFGNLRGVQWRMGLGILPPSSTIDDLRRVTADSRRR